MSRRMAWIGAAIGLVAVVGWLAIVRESRVAGAAALAAVGDWHQRQGTTSAGTLTVADADNYGRTWRMVVEGNGPAVQVDLFATRGLGPIPLLNSVSSLRVVALDPLTPPRE